MKARSLKSSAALLVLLAGSFANAGSDTTCVVKALERLSDHQSYSVLAKTDRGNFFVKADLEPDGTLLLNFRTRAPGGFRAEGLRGATEFRRAMQHFGGKVKRIAGAWYFSSDNLRQFNDLIEKGASAEEAARRTWTGEQAVEQGFTRIRISELEGTPPKYRGVRVYFERPAETR